ncbi:ImmA/IrrE family metallo-endopeptidase, partial [Enterococcus dongliensis]
KRTTAAHELGHAVLHPSENTPMLSKTTIVSELKIEKEANYFATNLIVDKEKYFEEYNYENVCTYGMLNHYGLPEHFARYI